MVFDVAYAPYCDIRLGCPNLGYVSISNSLYFDQLFVYIRGGRTLLNLSISRLHWIIAKDAKV